MGKKKARKSDIVDELLEIIDKTESRSSRPENKQTEDWLALVVRILGRLNCTDEGSDPIQDIMGLLKSFTGIESVDIRLREGYATIWRTENLSPTQSHLTSTKAGKGVDGNPERTPCIECMFTTIISGETDSSLPFFTERGSFWANSRSDYLSAISAKGLHGQCDDEGYESLALIPLRSNQELIGVLELKDAHPNRLDLTMIQFLENIGASIGIALARIQAKEALEVSQEKWRSLVDNAPNIIMIAGRDGTIQFVNRATPGGRREEARGKNIYDYIAPEYHHEVKEVIKQAFETGMGGRYESEVAVPGRSLSWYVTEVGPIKHGGQVVAVTLITTDITERKKAEDAVRLAHTELRQIFNTAAGGMRVIDKDFNIVRVNRTFATLASTTEDETVGKKCYQVLPGPLCHTPGCVLARILGGEERVEWEGEKERKDGSRIPCILTATPFLGPDGDLIGVVEDFRDITDRKRVEEALRESEDRFRAMIESTSDWVWEVDEKAVYTYASPKVKELLGYEPEEVVGRTPWDLMPPEKAKRIAAEFGAIAEARRPFSELENTNRHKDGRLLVLETSGVPIFDPAGNFRGYRGIDRDITERRKAEEALRESEERFRGFFENEPEYCYMVSPEGVILNANKAAHDALGYKKNELVGKPLREIYAPESHPKMKRLFSKWKTSGTLRDEEMVIVSKKGERLAVLLSASVIRDNDGKVLHSVSIQRDITKRKKVEEALHQRSHDLEERVKELNCLYQVGNLLEASDISLDELVQRTVVLLPPSWQYPSITCARIVLEGIERRTENFRETAWRQSSDITAGGERYGSVEVHYLEERSELDEGPFLREERNLIDAIAEQLGGFLERKRAEGEKERMEAQLRQAQKMEAIGRLAGGMAHDFNNLLTAIRGYSDLALMKLPGNGPAQKDVEHIRKASIRAAKLTEQLLLLSRPQPVAFKSLSLNKVISNLLKMLKRIIGENFSIVTDLDPVPRTVCADAGHMEQTIMNMVVNAKDAMREGGKITIRTENVHIDQKYCNTDSYARPGEFVCLSIEDTGVGMDNWTISHIFEPFFTTKDRKKGTGLGLSIVYGIVRQHKGWIDVESTPGEGSTFRIYLPSSLQKGKEESKETSSDQATRGKGPG